MTLNPDIYSTEKRLIFVPVRHHSPACARIVRELATATRPAAILIEGPADFNDKLHEMALPHDLPIAIYSYVRMADERRRGAFYPFCEYSPEWQAIQVAGKLKAELRFIDLPHVYMTIDSDTPENRYADGHLQQSSYIKTLADELGVSNFDDLWDTLFEVEDLSPDVFLERAHFFMFHLRQTAPQIRPTDIRREAYMTRFIREMMQQTDGRIMIVTGGFHSSALFERLQHPPQDDALQDYETDLEHGIALTPYSYQRLDNLKGYESGMPNPGFYHHIWQDMQRGRAETYKTFLERVTLMLRERKQIVSAADLIAVETTAKALAQLRGRERVWRRDLIDGIISALVKDELAYDFGHPFLEAIYEVFRGNERGKLAEGTSLPPLVADIEQTLRSYDLYPEESGEARRVRIDLSQPDDLKKSRILHQVRVLGLPGFVLLHSGIVPGYGADDEIREAWEFRWFPEFDAACIESSIYGGSLLEASQARLREHAQTLLHSTDPDNPPDAARASQILLDAALMGLPQNAGEFYQSLTDIINQDGQFFTVAQALSNLLYLYRFDTLLGTVNHSDVAELLKTAFTRSLWLLENIGTVTDKAKELLEGIKALLETFERCQPILKFPRADFVQVFRYIASDRSQTPLQVGAVSGVLLLMHEIQTADVLDTMRYFSRDPQQPGDYLTGFFYLAREAVQRQPAFIKAIDDLLMAYDDERFLEALPPMRLAFTVFTPREKHLFAASLFTDGDTLDPLADLEVNTQVAAHVMAFEAALFKEMEKYGVI